MHSLLNFIPISYTIYSRLESKKHFLSWAYLFPFFGFFAYFFYGEFSSLLIYPLFFYAVISLYEIGYLYNDIYSVKKERSPTDRVFDQWFVVNFNRLVLSRVIFVILFLFLIWMLIPFDKFVVFFTFLMLLGFSFYLHNTIRGRLNVLTFCFLSFMKYSTLLVFLNDYTLIALTFLSFTFLRTIEYAAVKKHIPKLDFITKDFHSFRMVYYFILVVLSFFMAFNKIIDFEYVLIPLYFFIYRFFIFFCFSGFINRLKGG